MQKALTGRSALAREYTEADLSAGFRANGSGSPVRDHFKTYIWSAVVPTTWCYSHASNRHSGAQTNLVNAAASCRPNCPRPPLLV